MTAVIGQAAGASPTETLARDITRELVEINTAPSGGPGQTLRAAQSLVNRLLAAGFPAADVQVLGLAPGDGNLVVRYRSRAPSHPPILLMAHLDVVEAPAVDWDTDPFRFVEKDGYWYGRGTRDQKGGAAILVANFIRLRREGFVPDRDLVILLTADEETTQANTEWLISKHRPLIDAGLALNIDSGLVSAPGGKPDSFIFANGEKLYADFAFEAHSPGGHSSEPVADNSIYKLAAALARLERFRFPRDVSDSTREFFRRWSRIAPPELRQAALALGAGRIDDPGIDTLELSQYLAPLIRTTCVATELKGGQARNALPQTAQATVNCRILPQSSVARTKAELDRLAQGTGVSVRTIFEGPGAATSPLTPDILEAVEAVSAEIWPGIPVLPVIDLGESDGAFTRRVGIPTYGLSAIAEDLSDDRWHAPNERVSVKAFNDALEFWYRLVRRLAGS